MNGYQRRLLILLCFATLSSGFAGFSLSQTLPALRKEFNLGPEAAGSFIALINIGQVLSYFLVRSADRWGRRPLFLLSLAGFSVLCAVSGFTSTALGFGLTQLLTRVFLLALAPLAAILATEELPAPRRGAITGAIFVFGGLGGVLCSALVPLLSRTPLGWRTVYLLSGLALLALGPGLLWVKESACFRELAPDARPKNDLWSVWRSGHGGRVLSLSAVFFLNNICASSAILFWKEFALAERGLSELQIGGIIASASLLAIPIAFLLGQLSDRLGRHRSALVIYSVAILGIAGAFTLRDPFSLGVSLLCAISGSWALPGLLSTLTAESFPTAVRAAAFAWANNLIGRAAFIAAPLLIGRLAKHLGWGVSVLLTLIAPIVSLAILLRMRETAGKSLAQIDRSG